MTVLGVEHGQFAVLSEEWGLKAISIFRYVDRFHRLAAPALLMEELLRHRRTLLFRHLQRRSVAVRAAFNRYVSDGLALRDVVAILSPPDSRATIPHADGHAILQLQLLGQKDWQFWDVVDDALVDKAPSVAALAQTFKDHAESHPGTRVTLAPGDMLFLPKRALHTATATTTFSLSLSFQLPDHWDAHTDATVADPVYDVFRRTIMI